MPNYKVLYFKLFSAMADAVEDLENQDFNAAWERLVRAQREAEEEHLSEE